MTVRKWIIDYLRDDRDLFKLFERAAEKNARKKKQVEEEK